MFREFFPKWKRSIATASTQSVRSSTWRSATEIPAAILWSVCAWDIAFASTLPSTLRWPCTGFCVVFATTRALSAWLVLRARARLAGRAIEVMRMPELIQRLQHLGVPVIDAQAATTGRCDISRTPVWFGLGFDWTPEASQRLYECTKVDAEQLVPPVWLCPLLTGHAPKDPDAIGLGALHGMCDREINLTVTEKTLEGGTMIVGTTQAGKGVLLTTLVAQSILRGDTVIILDPKNSSRLADAVRSAAQAVHRDDIYFFHPGGNSTVCLNPMASFSRTSELATRITSIMPDDGPFTAFAWSALNVIAMLAVYLDRTPTIALFADTMNTGIEPLLRDALCRALGKAVFDQALQDAIARGHHGREQTEDILSFWEQSADHSQEAFTAIAAAAAVFRHDPEHYAKITASLTPILSMLTSGDLRTLLSPTRAPSGVRTKLTLSKLIANGGILYVALDALPDPIVAQSLGAMLLSDLAACAGERYNKGLSRSRVTLFVDECSNVINRPLIEILNKGAESGIRTTCAMQTVSDLAARLGSTDAARMALGNFNNLIALRSKDKATQEFIAETFGRTYIAAVNASFSSSSRTASPGAFQAAYSRHMTAERTESIPTDMLGKLPNCEFFASLAGGRLVKGRIPILVSTSPES